MESLQSFEQYRELTGAFRGRKDVVSNVFFLPGAIKAEIAAGRFLVQSERDCLFIFQKEPGFYRLYFYATEESAQLFQPQCDEPMVVELPFGEVMDATTEALQKTLLGWGFVLGRESGRMAASSEAVHCDAVPSEYIQEAKPKDMETVYSLLYETFDPLFAFLPTREGLLKNIDEGNVLVYRKDDRILGVLRMERGRNYASISQFLIAKENRNLGLGRIFLEEFHRRCQVRPKFWHWVDLKNQSAIRLYEKEGYAFDGRYANEYIKLNKQENVPC